MNTLQKICYSSIRHPRLFLIISFLILSLSSCIKKTPAKPQLQSGVNVVNASVGLPPITFYINGIKVEGTSLKYNEESKYFITFPGKLNFDFAVEGQTGTILSTSFDLKENTYHSIFVSGDAAALVTLFTTDDLSNPPAGKAKLRFINLVSDSGTLAFGIKQGTQPLIDQSYNTASSFITIDPGVYDLQLKTSTGTILYQKNVTVSAGKIYNAWSNGLTSGVSNSSLGIQFVVIN